MIQLIGVLFAVALLIVAFQALWPLLLAAAAIGAGIAAYRVVGAHEDAQAAKRAAYERAVIKRANKQHKAILNGDTPLGTYGAYPPKVTVPFIDGLKASERKKTG